MMYKAFFLLWFMPLYVLGAYIEEVAVTPHTPDLNFQTIHNFDAFQHASLPVKLQSTQDYWVKIKVSEALFKEQYDYLLVLESEFGRDTLSYSKTYSSDPIYNNVLHLKDRSQDTVYIKIHNLTNAIYLQAKIIEQRAFYTAQRTEQILYGISYGIMMTAIFYYMAFFLYNREKTYIYYSLTQLFMLISLVMVTQKSADATDELLFAHIVSCFYVATSLFSSAFLQLHKFSPYYNRVMIVSVLILILEAYTNFFTKLHIPTAQLMLVYPIIAIFILLKTRFTHILFYIIGWGVLIVSLFFIELQIIFFKVHVLSADNVLHIVMPLESLVFALAISYKMRLESLEKRQKEQLLIHYDKKASIGDMIDNIAHQWRQPLTHIGYLVMNISAAIANHKFDINVWNQKHEAITAQLNYMSETITAFRDFYKPSLEKNDFDVDESIHKILLIIEPQLRLQDIELQLKKQTSLRLYGNENELSQVLLNLLVNAKEAFETIEVPHKTITITIGEHDITIDDNAGGVAKAMKAILFDSYTTTKSGGSGIGLAMSRLIVEQHFKGTLEYIEIPNGSRFCLTLK